MSQGFGNPAYGNFSPGEHRTGRACAWIEHGGRVLMSARDEWGWTLPGGGIHPGETAVQAAIREAWEEAGAHCIVAGEPVWLSEGAACYPMRLLALEPSPENRPVLWVNPQSIWWASDRQVWQVLVAQGRRAPPARVAAELRKVHRIRLQWQARLSARLKG